MYNILIGGEAGQGIDTTVAILEKLLKRSGYNVFTVRDFMSRIRGGHNFSLLRFGIEEIVSHSNKLDAVVALSAETIELHKHELLPKGFILCDSKIPTDDKRVIKIDLEDMAKSLGSARLTGTIALGAILKIFGENLDHVGEILKSFIKEQFFEMNVKAVTEGYKIAVKKYPHLKGENSKKMILTGNKALTLGAIASGLRFYSAYPMSPSTSIMDYLNSTSERTNIVVEQAEDEIAAINMAIGASFAGARAMTGTSGGGFSLMVEALGLSGMAEIPLVIVNAQRPGPTTGLPTRTEQSDLKFVISASQGEFPRMVIALRNHIDSFYQTVRAFNLAEKYQIPVIILSDQYLADASATIMPYDLEGLHIEPVGTKNLKASGNKTGKSANEEYLRYQITKDGISPRLIPGKSKNLVSADSDEHDENGAITESSIMRTDMVDKRMKKLLKLEKELQEPEFLGPEMYDTLILGWGSTYGPISEAIKLLNASEKGRYAALIFGDIYPLPQKMLSEKAKGIKSIVNIEQNSTGQLAGLIREKTGIVCTSSILKYDGRQISAEEIVTRLRKGVKK